MKDLKVRIAIIIAKLSVIFLKLAGRGSATAFPGYLLERISADALEFLCSGLIEPIVITGTNGKTTTQNFLGSILAAHKEKYLANSAGSNMKRGLLSTLVKGASWTGMPPAARAIFEIEEATMPRVIQAIKPKVIIVTNLFRDQLDAYGEIDRTQKFIRESITLMPDATVILNGDDPRVNLIADNLSNKKIFFGIDPSFRKFFKYEGKPNNQFKSEIVKALNIKSDSPGKTTFTLESEHFDIQSLGFFHVYNATAAILAAKVINVPSTQIRQGLTVTPPAFGRGEEIIQDGVNYKMILIKNPAGANVTFNLLKNYKRPNLAFILNDDIADGRDVSWIWDSNFEELLEIKPRLIVVSGTRHFDMLLRIKYALGEQLKVTGHNEFFAPKLDTIILFIENTTDVHKHLQSADLGGKEIFVMPTYTAMLTMRKSILGRALNE